MSVIIIAGVYLSGIMSPMETPYVTQGIMVSVTGASAKNSLAMHKLAIVSVTPSPTPAPSSSSSGSNPTTTTTPGSGAHVAGSLLCGTNLHLDDDTDTFLTSAAFRNGLVSAHVTTIRLPIRAVGGINPREIQAAKYIKDLGMTPLVILKFAQTDPAGAAKKVITEMNTIFGSSIVYYEFGNERDLAGTTQTQYTTGWNQVIPQIKSLPTNGKFGGPVNYQSDPAYIAYLVKNATPKPDYISWHEYTCNSSEATSACTGDIAKWKTHIAAIKQAITGNGDTVPPMMVTEWNYAPDAGVASDTKHTDSTFLTDWTTKAIQELAADGVFASYHYDVTNSLPLVATNGTPTAQGKAFSTACANL